MRERREPTEHLRLGLWFACGRSFCDCCTTCSAWGGGGGWGVTPSGHRAASPCLASMLCARLRGAKLETTQSSIPDLHTIQKVAQDTASPPGIRNRSRTCHTKLLEPPSKSARSRHLPRPCTASADCRTAGFLEWGCFLLGLFSSRALKNDLGFVTFGGGFGLDS